MMMMVGFVDSIQEGQICENVVWQFEMTLKEKTNGRHTRDRGMKVIRLYINEVCRR